MRIYFLGIAGTAMGNAALLLRAMGHEVFGCDQAIYPPMSTLLEDAGIEIMQGYSVQRLQKLDPNLVVVGNAYSRGNEEVEFLLETRSIEYTSLPDVLSRLILSRRENVVVTGTHGKTTTTAITSFLLEQASQDPGYMIGGAPIDPARGWRIGFEGGPFVIEGDEYDSAFFDKRSKFIHYQPKVVVLNNLEFDHADIFRDLQDVKRTFSHLLRLVPKNGYVLVNADDGNALSLTDLDFTTIYRVGTAHDADLRIDNYETTELGSRFELLWQGRPWASVEWGMSGLFNARNAAMASLAAALISENSSSAMPNPRVSHFDPSALARFRGVKRRQQLRVEREGLTVIEDFGHHATAVRDTLSALRSRFTDTVIVACFEPRSNTSRLEMMRAPTIAALQLADVAYIGAVKSRNSADVQLMDTFSLAEDLNKTGTEARAFENNEELFATLQALAVKRVRKTLVIFFSNGSFGGVIERFVTECQ
ncbi:Mur ligase family protein [Pelagicoccus sp. SDUM812002]|uniref:UDP-N-acetylmuramate--L-alanine ligase n=1 Tax=Pelagicoccus sp. SDUM812002 TaxID=3041266 RepID=UPI00280E38E2|nr:Mur ligase family protein [Pelagicoccus sp. SDUM812002]MDQ8186153.1 Mur ligase family protein [Pelagicoccus sp. SDUM812002]